MWTAKRIIILFGALCACLTGYAVYAQFLGAIDGLPPMPERYLPGPDGPPPPPGTGNEVDERLQMAFGVNCKEVQRPLKLWIPDRLVAFAAGEFSIDPDGRVKLAPFSAAKYHQTKSPNAYPEISTIRADVAYLTLDRPISNLSELNNRKVIAVELTGKQPGVTLTNNRGTAEKNDDIDILITNGNLFWEERRDLIWTNGIVCLTDYQTKPATVVRGKGMKMILAKDSGPNQRPKVNAKVQRANPNTDSNNIEKIILEADVEMHFWVDSRAGFLGGAPPAKTPPLVTEAADPQNPLDKAHIRITTGGPFVYDLTKEFAWFESPAPRDNAKSEPDPIAPDQVHVERRQTVAGKVKLDQLICDRLDLQFRRRINYTANLGDTQGSDKEIETAKATKQGKNDVVLALDSEGMAAFGNEMFYRAGDAVSGPLTILKGEPLHSLKDGHKMVSKELHLFAADRAGEGQHAEAIGSGKIDLLDAKGPDKDAFPTHIHFRENLTVVKVKEGGQVFDLITVKGNASFIDDLQKQELHGEKIMVWMRRNDESANKPMANGGGKQELHRVYAQGRVRAVSPEYVIRHTERLTMTFLPEVARNDFLPSLETKVEAMRPTDVKAGPPAIPSIGADNDKAAIVEAKTPSQPKKPAPPIELQGNEITMHMSTLGTKKELQEMIAKGNVYVFQAGDNAGEKRIDIKGQLLTVKNADKGHTIVVHGDPKNFARVEIGEMILWGPLVTMNRGDNRLDVDGQGAMQMPSNTNLDGTPSKDKTKSAAKVIIHWKKSMNFDGKNADFWGGVQGFQEGASSRMLCEHLIAILDKSVSFKEGQKDNQSAKVDRLICDKNVYVDDSKVDDRKHLVQRSIIEGKLLSTDNQEGPTTVVGPGIARLLAMGTADADMAPPPGNKLAPVWKLTRIEFPERMFSNTKAANKNAKFYANPGNYVEVYHFPFAPGQKVDINAKMDADRPPKDGFFLRCEILSVEGKQAGDRTAQSMIAERNVYFKTDKYHGRADILKYDENTDIVILEGTNGNLVQLHNNNTGAPASVKSSKVLYNRRTGEVESVGVKSIQK